MHVLAASAVVQTHVCCPVLVLGIKKGPFTTVAGFRKSVCVPRPVAEVSRLRLASKTQTEQAEHTPLESDAQP